MENMNKYNIIALIIVAIFVFGGAAYWYYQQNTDSQGQSLAGESISDWESLVRKSVSEWEFQGAYSGDHELETKAKNEITRLEELVGSGEETDYSYYVSIAGQYGYLGDGEKEYEYLRKALAIDSETTGLAWHNMGSLMARLGAKEAARSAYARAMKAQPIPQYITAYLEYLTQNFPEDSVAIEVAFTDAVQVSGADSSAFWEIKARWLENTGKLQEAIDAWEKVKGFSPAAAALIDVEIARLRGEI